mmetsp:Transcript_19517/g.69100  ORF Transcript_19517/g.69100 Transcript_19517/m.69100 type:complete len:348 (-) Transcript_19517:72-1115(-)|eukprot:CAMPEP_0203808642 /NCGR_PEP_ID=MMETSP0115-20131106/1730_1 /ASSEMBLY_ACC=CAM_ASM_000227 /TAXON_ID=33651 /ORGANISM="Bicosoecid sp, Strain ms1" /LENGTH=347 /DNA_ID=CAMNT_0050717335 /DNA_START=103 /DNA_END=1146 /DNA_ORIENTATION=+
MESAAASVPSATHASAAPTSPLASAAAHTASDCVAATSTVAAVSSRASAAVGSAGSAVAAAAVATAAVLARRGNHVGAADAATRSTSSNRHPLAATRGAVVHHHLARAHVGDVAEELGRDVPREQHVVLGSPQAAARCQEPTDVEEHEHLRRRPHAADHARGAQQARREVHVRAAHRAQPGRANGLPRRQLGAVHRQRRVGRIRHLGQQRVGVQAGERVALVRANEQPAARIVAQQAKPPLVVLINDAQRHRLVGARVAQDRQRQQIGQQHVPILADRHPEVVSLVAQHRRHRPADATLHRLALAATKPQSRAAAAATTAAALVAIIAPRITRHGATCAFTPQRPAT